MKENNMKHGNYILIKCNYQALTPHVQENKPHAKVGKLISKTTRAYKPLLFGGDFYTIVSH